MRRGKTNAYIYRMYLYEYRMTVTTHMRAVEQQHDEKLLAFIDWTAYGRVDSLI